MATITASVTISLNFETEDGLVTTEEEAVSQLFDYISTGVNPNMVDVKVTTT